MTGWGRRRRTSALNDENEPTESIGGSTSGEPRPPRVRRLRLRTVLLVIVIVPSVTFTPLLASGMYQLSSQWQAEKVQMDLMTTTVGGPAADLFFALEQERRLSAEAQAGPGSTIRDKLDKQRTVTDQAVRTFRPLVSLDLADGQEGLTSAIARTQGALDLLDQQRRAMDADWFSGQRVFDYYSGLLESNLSVLTALSKAGEGRVQTEAQTWVDLFWILDMLGREDAVLARGWENGRLTRTEYGLVTEAIGARNHLMRVRVVPALTGEETRYAKMTDSQAWRTMTAVEGRLALAAADSGGDQVRLRDDGAAWRSSSGTVTTQLRELLGLRFARIGTVGYALADVIFVVFITISTIGLLALGLVVVSSWRLTAILRRRILHLRHDAHELQERLPEVVARLERGEDVDVDAEARMIKPTDDELGELGQALNLARRSAVRTAVRQAEQHRGFQRMLQRIARRTQILIGLQLKKLDELERRHEDPEVLEGLFDLDHLTARLRRYEENLVILGGGQPQRRWRKPVPLLDILRAAQSEVQDYRRISIDVQGEPWVAERAVGPLIHVLAELMENATTFSKPLTPVEVRAASVSRGIAVEIEDRGLGMDPEGYDAANALLQAPPQLDVMTHADDVRLGLYVVARLSASLGLQVELRSSAFGGTRVVVLLPETLTVDRPPTVSEPTSLFEKVPPGYSAARAAEGTADPRPPHDDALPARARGRAMASVAAPAATPDRGDPPVPSSRRPLPQRVRQASLSEELKAPADTDDRGDQENRAVHDQPSRSSATIGAFQRQSRRRRADEDASQPRPSGSAGLTSPTTEDR